MYNFDIELFNVSLLNENTSPDISVGTRTAKEEEDFS